MNWLKKKWAYFYRTFISLKGPPEKIARAFSVGFWVAWWPIIGTHSILAAAGGLIFRVNLPAVYLASWLCNPLTIPPMLALDYQLGAWLIGGVNLQNVTFAEITFRQMIALGWDILLPMIVGGVLLGTINAFVAYYPIKRAVIRVRARQLPPLPGKTP